ncbi:MAG: lamin tail domain-containing protein [Verrucomicrobia bacterium]|nr:lamin tail domain-containing protein [Verrucomicrobiota bacterium]
MSARSDPLGPSSRLTGLVVSEIMYHPPVRADGKDLAYVELFNAQEVAAELGGFRLSGAVDFIFPANARLAAGSFLVVARQPGDVQSAYGIANVLGGWTNDLAQGTGTIRLRNRIGAVLLEAKFSAQPPWPVAADGAGHSLVLARPSLGEAAPGAWAACRLIGGSPGRAEPELADPFRSLVINEVLARSDGSQAAFVELYNHSRQTIDLGGCVLSDDPALTKFTVPSPTLMAPGGFVFFDEVQLGFALRSGESTVYLFDPSLTRVVDAVRVEAHTKGAASGRYRDGTPGFCELTKPTPGAPNTPPLPGGIVINEIMYHPISGDDADSYVELHNRSATPVSVGGWRFVDGIEFTFPQRTVPAGGYLVVAKDTARLLSSYPELNALRVVGPFQGNLSRAGERLALARPESVVVTNANQTLTTNLHFVVVNEIIYGTGGRWGRWSDGGGSSLELSDARSDNRRAANWADSDEAAKSAWTTIEHTGVLDYGADVCNALLVLAQGPGEFLLDDVEVFLAGGSNLVTNETFEAGLSGWSLGGTHADSGLESTGGFLSAQCLHVRASGRGDTGANRVRVPLKSPLPVGATATIRAKVRWLRGWPEVLLRLYGNYLEAYGPLNLPRNLATPGARNSRALPNTGPAISDVTHSPILPAGNEPVVVTATVDDPDGVAQVVLRFRNDPDTALVSVPMRDDGTGGDAVAGDGTFTATLPAQAAGTLIAFHLEATDSATVAATRRFPNDAPARECLVRFGEAAPPGQFTTYRLWMTKAVADKWTARPQLDNHPLDVTFVYGNERAIYNVGALYAGSPHIAPGFSGPAGTLCGYVLVFPPDDRLLGATDVVLDWPGRDSSGVLEPAVYWMADQMDLPYIHRRFVHLYVNGVTSTARGSIYEDTQQVNARYLEAWSPDAPDGDLFKIEQWFEFSPSGGRSIVPVGPTLHNFVTTGSAKKLARYRWNWLKRAVRDSADDYESLFALADALNTPGDAAYTAQVEALADVEQWMRIFALEHIVNNFDSYGHMLGKNMYAYKPPGARWQMHLWDLDWLLHISNRLGLTPESSLFDSEDPTILRMYQHPPFRRAYFRAVQDALKGPLADLKVNDYIDAKYAALVANGVTKSAGFMLAPPDAGKNFLARRRDFLVQQLGTVAADFAIANNGGNDFTTDQNLVTLSGTAPIDVKTIQINGVTCPVHWTTVTNWTLRVALPAGINRLVLQSFDPSGLPLPQAAGAITVTVTGAYDPPQGPLVINEIMPRPAEAGAEFIELLNISAATAFDLFGYRLDGVGFEFTERTVVPPNGFVVVAKDRTGFAKTYGRAIPVAGTFPGSLDPAGEVLRLVKPGSTRASDETIDEVAFEGTPPWPASAEGSGASLQLIDPLQDNTRVANWAVAPASPPSPEPQWQFVSATGPASTSQLLIYLTAPGDVHLDDVKLVAGTEAEVGENLVRNGDFESAWPGPWATSPNHAASALSTAAKHSGASSLHLVASSAGTNLDSSVWQPLGPLVINAIYTLSFWYQPSADGSVVTARLAGNGILINQNLQPAAHAGRATPGAPNSVRTTLAAFPEIWLNELQPDNRSGITDRLGHRGPWVELFNAGAETIDLRDFFLTDDYAQLAKWQFPEGATLASREALVVWLDGHVSESTPNEPHTSFALATEAGSLALSQETAGRLRVIDYLNYGTVPPDRSLGLFPDGQANRRQFFVLPTPGRVNDPAAAPAPVFINEWMAGNTFSLADPADGQFDDWLELHNPNPFPVALTGYSLTDDDLVPRKWLFPMGATISAHGFRLVWADRQSEQSAAEGDLHADFRLNREGDEILLFAPDGRTQVDHVRYGPQLADVSEGRWPDGSAEVYAMTPPTPGAPNSVAAGDDLRILGVTGPADGLVQIVWATQPGRTYRLQFKDDLQPPSWSDIGDVTADDTIATRADAITRRQQRFYRIQLVR